MDVLPAEKVFCDSVIEGGKDGEEETREELLEAETFPLSLKSFLKPIFFFIFNLIFPLIFSFLFFYDPDLRLIHYLHSNSIQCAVELNTYLQLNTGERCVLENRSHTILIKSDVNVTILRVGFPLID